MRDYCGSCCGITIVTLTHFLQCYSHFNIVLKERSLRICKSSQKKELSTDTKESAVNVGHMVDHFILVANESIMII